MQHLQANTTLQGGKYKIERMLGQGGFGITYLAEQKSLGRCVVVKEFFMKDFCTRDDTTRTVRIPTAGSRKQVEQYRKKFIKEARNLARLNHPHIISVIDVFEENDTVYYVMPYLSGGSLLDYVKTHGTLSEQDAMKYVKQIAGALKYMHEEQHICHYDVKPANILLDDKGNAVLIDFGISKNYDASGQETTTTPVGMSDGYAPIEQYQQKLEEFSPSSDVYGLGATLYFLLHGKRPVSAVLRASGAPLVTGKKLSQSIKNLIFFSMEISKRDRAKNVDVFLEDISTTTYKSHTDVKDDEEDTILENTTSSSNSGINSQETHNGNKSYIGWITGFLIITLVFGGLIYSGWEPREVAYLPDFLSKNDKNDHVDSVKRFTICDVTFEMLRVDGGSFRMGNAFDGRRDEEPIRTVELDTFYIGKVEVTQQLWVAVMNSNPAKHQAPNLPVENVSWDDCQIFIKKLNKLIGKKFRLPTEAEWEFAARGGMKSKGYKYSGSNILNDVAWSWYSGFTDTIRRKSGWVCAFVKEETHPIATKQSNELGLYDMSGNVWEWCQDWYGEYDSTSPIANPAGPNDGSHKVIRGGSFGNQGEDNFRVTCRFSKKPEFTSERIGLRLVLP